MYRMGGAPQWGAAHAVHHQSGAPPSGALSLVGAVHHVHARFFFFLHLNKSEK